MPSPTAAVSTLTFALSLTLTCLVTFSEAKVVVVIPFPYTSHTKYHTNSARALSERGHQVWVTIPTYLLDKGYLDTSGFNVIPYEAIPNLEKRTLDVVGRMYFEGRQDDIFEFLRICDTISDALLKNSSFIEVIKRKQPDLIVIDNLAIFYTMSVLPYKLGVPFAFLGSTYHPQMMNIPFSPAEVPLLLFPYTNHMTFFQRLHNTLYYVLFSIYNPSFKTDAVAKYAPEMVYRSLNDLVLQAEVFLVELDHVLDYPKPTLPNVKLIGGTATGPAKALPPEFQSFMDGAEEGVVIVSFGSYILDLPKRISEKIFHVLSELPMKSVFRSNLTSPDPEKILTSPWIPQNDLLGHPHTKAFVSHCGKNGQYEALYHAVPIVATPLFIDQPFNAERARVKGFAEVLDLNTCTVDEFKSTILTVVKEPRYKQAIVKRSRLFKELYGVPLKTAAYWLDHVMEYGGDYMRSAGQQMPLYQFMLLDVVLFIVCVLAFIVGLMWVVIKALCSCLRTKKVKKA